MQFKTFVATAALLSTLLHGITCAPLPLGHTIDTSVQTTGTPQYDADAGRVNQAVTDAHAQIQLMHTAIHNPTVPAHKEAIEKAFGKNPDMDALRNHVNTLRDGHITVSHVRSNQLGDHTLASTNPATGEIRLGSAFHEATDKERAGTIVHESTHALGNTRDWWSKNDAGTYTSHTNADRPDNALSGYHHLSTGLHMPGKHPNKQFQTLRAENSPQMHLNADSWRHFGNKLTSGQDTSGAGPSSSR
jgi:hypothetical protein